MSAIVRAARSPVLFRLMLGVVTALVSYEATRMLIEFAGGVVR